MDISQSTFTMYKELVTVMNHAANTLAKRSSYMSNCLQELNVLRVFAEEHDFDFAVGDLVVNKDLTVFIAASMESFASSENELLDTFKTETDWHVGDGVRHFPVECPALFDEYIVQKSFLAVSPVGQGQQSEIHIFFFAK